MTTRLYRSLQALLLLLLGLFLGSPVVRADHLVHQYPLPASDAARAR
jgi:hypothetical protein